MKRIVLNLAAIFSLVTAPDARLTPDIARELCQRTGSAAVLDGSITQVGTPYLVTVEAVDCTNGESRILQTDLLRRPPLGAPPRIASP